MFRSQRGSVAVNIAIVAVVLIGMVALGVEMTYLLLKHRQMQAATDSGAIAAAAALGTGGDHAVLVAEAEGVAAKGTFVSGTDGTTVTVNNPPSHGPNSANPNAVEVIIAQPQTLGLVKLFRSGIFTVSTRSVAVTTQSSKFCILGLSSTASPAVHLENNAAITNPNCGVVSNSANGAGILLDNNTSIAGQAYSHGGISKGHGVTVGSERSSQPPVDDPYASVTPGTPPACTAQSGTGGGTRNITNPTGYIHFCSGWNWGNNATINLQPGVYYIDSQLSTGNGVTINGTGGVTIILNSSYAISWGGHNNLNITAPTSGTFEGLAVYSPATNSSSITQVFWNNMIGTISGALYFPSQPFLLRNNGTLNATNCTQIIASTVDLRNNVTSNSLCAKAINAGGSAKLVE